MNLINILKRQAELYKKILSARMEEVNTESDIREIHASVMKDFYTKAYKSSIDPYLKKNITSKDMDEIITMGAGDIEIAYEEVERVSDEIAEVFNSNQEYKTSLKNRINNLLSVTEDVNIMAEENMNNTVVFKDSLNSYDYIDKEFGQGRLANISTSEGVAHLATADDKNINESIKAVRISGDGAAGNYHIVRKVKVETYNSDYNVYLSYKSEENPHDNLEAIADDNPATWIEYQKLGLPSSYDQYGYETPWANAKKMSDELTLKINIELKQIENINWIDISPYLPERSKANISLYSVRTSEDGSNYQPIYKEKPVIDKEIYTVNQVYDKDDLFSKDSVTKLISQGVLNFPMVEARHVEIILKQYNHYAETLGTTVYTKSVLSGDREIQKGTIKEQLVPVFVVQGPLGKYRVSSNEFITKEMVSLDGFRYSIGIRGVDAYNKRFHPKSEIITKRFETQKPIRKIMLYSNEIVPDVFYKHGIETRNDWIKYYISIDDIEWHQISPMHHNPVGGLGIPPKVFEINALISPEERVPNKGYINKDSEVKNVRLKIVLSGDASEDGSTPIIEEYAIKCITEGGAN